MYWHAEKQNGEIIVLTEREALIHFEKNNIAQRMRLRFLGTSSGQHQKEAKNRIIKEIMEPNYPDTYGQMSREEKNVVDQDIRFEHQDEIRAILKEAQEKELEEARKNGVKQPRKDLHIHTRSNDGHSREEILGAMK